MDANSQAKLANSLAKTLGLDINGGYLMLNIGMAVRAYLESAAEASADDAPIDAGDGDGDAGDFPADDDGLGGDLGVDDDGFGAGDLDPGDGLGDDLGGDFDNTDDGTGDFPADDNGDFGDLGGDFDGGDDAGDFPADDSGDFDLGGDFEEPVAAPPRRAAPAAAAPQRRAAAPAPAPQGRGRAAPAAPAPQPRRAAPPAPAPQGRRAAAPAPAPKNAARAAPAAAAVDHSALSNKELAEAVAAYGLAAAVKAKVAAGADKKTAHVQTLNNFEKQVANLSAKYSLEDLMERATSAGVKPRMPQGRPNEEKRKRYVIAALTAAGKVKV